MNKCKLRVQYLENYDLEKWGPLKKAKPGDAGVDLRAGIDTPICLRNNQILLVPTGLKLEIEDGWEVQVRPRSGMAKNGVTVNNSPGTIDSQFRGQVHVILINHGEAPYWIEKGERIAQAVVKQVPEVEIETVEHVNETERGEGGFGSTGKG